MSRKTYVTSVSGRTYTKSSIRDSKRALRQWNRSQRRYKREQRRISNSSSESGASSSSIFGVIFIILFLFAFVASVSGREVPVTFTGLLNALADAPSIDTTKILNFTDSMYIFSDWGSFDFLREFLNNYIIPLCVVAIYFCVSIAQLVMYLVWFVKFIFTGVA